MEDELNEWKELVKTRRKEFYELNYFNTMQLLSLRRELGSLKESECKANVSPEVLLLLQSISTKITPVAVTSAVYRVNDHEESSSAKAPNQFAEKALKVRNLAEDDLPRQQESLDGAYPALETDGYQSQEDSHIDW